MAGASRYILPALIAELRSSVSMFSGETFPCVQMDVYNWEDEVERKDFLAPCDREVYIPGTEIKVIIIIRNELPYCVVGKEQAALSCVGLMHMHCNQ